MHTVPIDFLQYPSEQYSISRQVKGNKKRRYTKSVWVLKVNLNLLDVKFNNFDNQIFDQHIKHLKLHNN